MVFSVSCFISAQHLALRRLPRRRRRRVWLQTKKMKTARRHFKDQRGRRDALIGRKKVTENNSTKIKQSKGQALTLSLSLFLLFHVHPSGPLSCDSAHPFLLLLFPPDSERACYSYELIKTVTVQSFLFSALPEPLPVVLTMFLPPRCRAPLIAMSSFQPVSWLVTSYSHIS